MVQQNPALIQPLLQQIAATNPELAQLINQNPQALYDLLGGAGDEGDEDDDMMGPQVMHVNLTQEEAAAVERVGAISHSGWCYDADGPARGARVRQAACSASVYAL